MHNSQNKKNIIAILVLFFPPERIGGTEIATFNIAKYLAKTGYEVHVITSSAQGVPQLEKEYGFITHRVSYCKLKFVGIMNFWFKSLLILEKICPDFVFAQDFIMSPSGFLFNFWKKKPYVVCGQGSDVFLSNAYERTFYKLTIKRAHSLVALTDQMKDKMKKYFSGDISVIPNGIDLEHFNIILKSYQHETNGALRGHVLICVARLNQVKGIKYLIEAMPTVIEKYKTVKLWIIGDGPDRNELESVSKKLNLTKYIEFKGIVPNERIPEYLSKSDVFLLPSLSEGLPISILEALASGLPVIATKVGGVPDIISDGKNGFLVSPGKPEELSEKVLLLLDNPVLRDKIRENNLESAKKYNWENIVKRLESIFEKC